jgi:tRNA (mo5U34)-methyltransferase
VTPATPLPNLTDAELRAEILRLGPWHYDFEIAPGIRTGTPAPDGTYAAELGRPTIISTSHFGQVLDAVYPDGLNGRSVLDCACNAGGYLFTTATRGAGRGFGFDAREHWIEQARFLARYLPSENLQFHVCELMSLPRLALEPFDVTLFFGILYHLPDPVAGLRIAADLTRELLIVNTDAVSAPFDGLVLNRESTTEVMSGVDGLAWLPTSERVLRAMLASCGFPHARLIFDKEMPYKRRRISIMGARDEKTFAHCDTLLPPPKPRRSRWRDRIRHLLR